MSGTSMDGIDVALLQTDGTPNLIEDLGHTSISYSNEFIILLKSAEYAIRLYEGDLIQAAENYRQALKNYLTIELQINEDSLLSQIEILSRYLNGQDNSGKAIHLQQIIDHSTDLHALAVNQLLTEKKLKPEQIDVVGYHGQAMFHQPNRKISVIVGSGLALANKIGITVINDFRRADIMAGGQGAPFAPLFHQALAVKSNLTPLAVVNCGGISNVTFVHGQREYDVMGFDTGPGNGLIDTLVRLRTHGLERMDKDGKYGRRGKISPPVLNALYEKAILKDGKNYLRLPPPKSLDYGDLILIPELLSLTLEDACATLEAFTAETIVNSLEFIMGVPPKHWILAGGGWHNPVIRAHLEQKLKQKLGNAVKIQTADEANWNSAAMEAQIFAYFAVRSLHNFPLSVPNTTRVPHPISGGQAHLPLTGGSEKVRELIKNNPLVLQVIR